MPACIQQHFAAHASNLSAASPSHCSLRSHTDVPACLQQHFAALTSNVTAVGRLAARCARILMLNGGEEGEGIWCQHAFSNTSMRMQVNSVRLRRLAARCARLPIQTRSQMEVADTAYQAAHTCCAHQRIARDLHDGTACQWLLATFAYRSERLRDGGLSASGTSHIHSATGAAR